jgi:hypothetical protein
MTDAATTTKKMPSRAGQLGLIMVERGLEEDAPACSRHAEVISGAVSGEVVGDLLSIAIKATLALARDRGIEFRDAWTGFDPGRRSTAFGFEGWSTAPDNSGGSTISAEPRR